MEIEGTVSTVQFALLRIDGVGISPATLLPSFPTQLHCCFVSMRPLLQFIIIQFVTVFFVLYYIYFWRGIEIEWNKSVQSISIRVTLFPSGWMTST